MPRTLRSPDPSVSPARLRDFGRSNKRIKPFLYMIFGYQLILTHKKINPFFWCIYTIYCLRAYLIFPIMDGKIVTPDTLLRKFFFLFISDSSLTNYGLGLFVSGASRTVNRAVNSLFRRWVISVIYPLYPIINRPSHWKSEVERRNQTWKAPLLYPIDRHDDASRRSSVQGKRERRERADW